MTQNEHSAGKRDQMSKRAEEDRFLGVADLVVAALLHQKISHIEVQVSKVGWVYCKQGTEVLHRSVYVLQTGCAHACSHLQQAQGLPQASGSLLQPMLHNRPDISSTSLANSGQNCAASSHLAKHAAGDVQLLQDTVMHDTKCTLGRVVFARQI